MLESNRPPPSAEELEHLTEAFRRDPARAFVDLGEALLALGRPRDAVEIGARGLKVDPSSIPGRLMVARAFSQVHQWKEAQAELLKVVKIDRNNGPAFRLLGEVLMRRSDFERALPVLQHAQNLNPADPSTLSLLRRARASVPLDPPPAIPTPLQPRPGGSGSQALDDAPTRVAGEIDTGAGRGDGGSGAAAAEASWGDESALGRVRLDRVEVRREGAARAPVEGGVRRRDDRGEAPNRRPVEHFAPPPTEDVFAPVGQDPRAGQPDPRAGRGARGAAPAGRPTGPDPAVRPRVMPIDKPRDAAQASLRQSAAVGEHYLNNLLVAGLLEVPRVRVPDAYRDVPAGRRWGRSTFRMFVYLFVLLGLGIAGGGGWYWYADKQRADDVARYLASARTLIDAGDYDQLLQADEDLRAAVERDRGNAYAVALLAHTSALELFLYGEVQPADVLTAINLAAQDITAPTMDGHRELVLARAAHTLAILPTLEQGADERLLEVRRALDGHLATRADDALARWLLGHAMWAAGERQAAAAAFEQADRGGQGPIVAAISLGDIRLDDGRFEEAKAIYDRALAASPRQPWGFLGRSLSRSERSFDIADAVADVNVGVARRLGPRVEAYKHLAMASAHLAQEDYKSFAAELELATGAAEPRFLVRLALLRVQQGKLAEAAAARSEIRWYAEKPQPDPLLLALNAELFLSSGLAREAYGAVEKDQGLRAAELRGRALFDLGKAEDARRELQEALEIAPSDLELQTWAEAARLVATSGDERKKADEALDSLGRKAKSKAARVPHGIALAAIGRSAAAREKLEMSLTDVSDEYPNPLAYRAHVVLAELDLAEGKGESALAHVDQALALNAGYLPVHDLACRLLIDGAPDKARPSCLEVVNAQVSSVGAELAYVRAVLPSKAAEDRAAAVAALKRAREKGATAEQLQAAVASVGDPTLGPEIGLAGPKPAQAPRGRRRR